MEDDFNNSNSNSNIHFIPVFQNYPGKPLPKGRTILDINEARDDGVAVVSDGPYANHLHFSPER